jgi:hypothetical protein
VIPPAAIQQFTERQRQLIHDTYDRAWQQGVAGYEPDAEPEQPTPRHLHRGEEASLTGAALLRARSQRRYRPPTAPDAARRQTALAGALRSTEVMAGELATLGPSPEHMAQAEQEADEGGNAGVDLATAALALAVADWAESNAYRLDAGESVAWSGEQAGYAEAADADGQLLQWQDEGDDHVCADCEGMAELGPLPLEDFPTTPGAGDTECNVGCRCGLEATGVPVEDQLAPLSEDEEAVLSKVAGQAQERLDQLAPQFATTG